MNQACFSSTEAIDAEAALDGLYVVRTSLSAEKLDAGAKVAAYRMTRRP